MIIDDNKYPGTGRITSRLSVTSFIFIAVLEALSRETGSRFPEKQLHTNDLTLLNEALEGLKKRCLVFGA